MFNFSLFGSETEPTGPGETETVPISKIDTYDANSEPHRVRMHREQISISDYSGT